MLSFGPVQQDAEEAENVAKRVRGKRSAAYKPGGQGPSRDKDSGGAQTAPPTLDVDAAIEDVTDAQIVETTEIAVAEPAATPRKRKGARRSARARAESLAGRAAAEESWVREDLRNIGMITVVLLVGLLVAWILFVPMNLGSFY